MIGSAGLARRVRWPLLWAAILAAGCDGAGGGGRPVAVGGSSSLYPLSEAVAESFLDTRPERRLTVDFSGTAAGLRRLCDGEIDIAGASRTMSTARAEACRAAGLRPVEIPVARDGIVLVAHPANTVVDCFTLEELRRLWEPARGVRSWRDLRPDYPAEPIRLFAPGSDSGTYRYFTSVVVGRPGASRSDHYQSENDDLIARGVAGERWGLGYLGSAAYTRNRDQLRALAVDTGFGCELPTPEAVADGRYSPLARDLYLYVGESALARDEVFELVAHYLDLAATLAPGMGYVALPEAAYGRSRAMLAAARPGRVSATVDPTREAGR